MREKFASPRCTMRFVDTLQELRHNRQRERAARDLRERITQERDSLVKRAFAEGHSGPEVAQAAGCSKERAYQIRDGK